MRNCSKCQLALAETVRFCPVDGTAMRRDPLIGQLLEGQFRVREKVGQGACGDVYQAWQRGVERTVAIKVLREEVAQLPEYAIRFTREAQAAARLTGPGIVRIYSLGHTQEGLPFIAMEWLQGETLRACIDSGETRKYSHDRVSSIGRQLASALSEAHASGIVHRDLKPDNIFVREMGDRLHLTVLDFGIAKLLDRKYVKLGESQLTRHGAVYGTPAYLSPEQASGCPVDARSDLYSVGVILFELLAGRLPFQSQGLSLLVEHVSGDIPDLHELDPSIPPELVRIVGRLLAKDPTERFQSAYELYQALDSGRGGAFVSECSDETVGDMEASQFQLPPFGAKLGRQSVLSAVLALGMLVAGKASIEGTASVTNMTGSLLAIVDEPILPGPQRATMISADGYSLRVLMPEELVASKSARITIDLWGPGGNAFDSTALVIVFSDSQNVHHGVSALPTGKPGHYVMDRSFEFSGKHTMQVLPEGGDVSLQVYFDVLPDSNS